MMGNVTVNLHGNRGAFLYPDPACFDGLAEAYARYDPKNLKPPFCIAQKSYTSNYIGGVKPIRICIDPDGSRPYGNGFAFLYQYNKHYAFYAMHMGEKTWIISTNDMRYGEAKIAEREAAGEWDEEKELRDLLWEKGDGPEDVYHGLVPALPTTPEFSATIKAAIIRVEDEPQAQMDALIVALKDYEHPGLRNFGPLRLQDLTLTTLLPPPRKCPVVSSDHEDSPERNTVSVGQISQEMDAEATKPVNRGVSASRLNGQFMVFNTNMDPPNGTESAYPNDSSLSVVDNAWARMIEGEEASETDRANRLDSDGINNQLWSGLN
ncbi:MAG: hypothetical protein Q9160_005386 [Pyrenula sp. 1 TL-2023]